MKAMSTTELYSGYNSDDGFTYSHEWNISPAFTVAQATFTGVDGGGLHHVGIMAYRFRPDPSGPEIPVNFGDDFHAWPGCVYVHNLSSVTFTVAVGAEQEVYIIENLFFW